VAAPGANRAGASRAGAEVWTFGTGGRSARPSTLEVREGGVVMRLTLRDLVATILVAAIGVPYVGYLIDGDMPFVKDARGMSAVGLVLGALAFLVLRTGNADDRVGTFETWGAVASMLLGFAALAFAETAAAEVLLAVFMGSILVVFLFEVADHAGLVHAHATP
jgi:hypothetical protein